MNTLGEFVAPASRRCRTAPDTGKTPVPPKSPLFFAARIRVPQVGRTRQTCAIQKTQVSAYRDLWHPASLLFILLIALAAPKASAQFLPNRPPPPPCNQRGGGPRQEIQLGRTLFFDTNLSNPAGMGCVSCHAPQAGFSFPDSQVNATLGPVPGAIAARYGNRKPPTISYTWLTLRGPPFYDRSQHAWVGGWFWDGRARDLQQQVRGPMLNPNEMNNLVHNVPSPELIVQKLSSVKYASQFKQVFGNDAFNQPDEEVFRLAGQAITAYERSNEVSPFNSRYDAYVAGRVQLTPSEMNGLRLFTGSTTGRPGGPHYVKSAHCVDCHSVADELDLNSSDLFTNASFANLGVPRNPANPYYKQTSATADPQGYNALGASYVDLGLGDFLYPRDGLPVGNIGPQSDGRGDYLQANGTFKTPTVRNVDKRPNPAFVKSYMHNGVFKSLKDVVHFLNTRNLTTAEGETIDFTQDQPYATLTGKPLWPKPEYSSPRTLLNPRGEASKIGNLGLSHQDESDLVAFLRTLSDGYFYRN